MKEKNVQVKEKNKVLLIEPGAKTTVYPPIGLLHLASVIRDKYDVIIKDYSGKELDEEKIYSQIKKINPFVIGLRVLTGPGILRAIKISKIAKKIGIPVIWGGPHPTILPEQTLKENYIDAVCIGEGEYTLIDLLDYFEGKKKQVLGAGIKKNGKIIIYPPQKKVVSFDNLPMPAWDLLEDIDRYFPEKRHNSLPVSTTRGCPFKCGFCHNSNKNVKSYLGCYRIAKPKRAIEEFKYVQSLTKNKIDYLDVGEDFHLISKEYAKEFCEEIKNSGIKNLKWNTSTRYALLDKEIIELIAKHNCKRIMLGIESGSKRIQEINGKIVDFNHAKKIARLLKKNKIFLTNTYIFGHPTETEEELNKTIKFIKEIPADENLIQLYRPMPGTPYFDLCIKHNKITKVPTTLEGWARFGVLGSDTNISEIPTKILFSTFYKTNLIKQTQYIFNMQKYYLRENMINKFIKNFFDNRFTFKLREYLISK